jgi:choline dehydrogenase-like flavoprotein
VNARGGAAVSFLRRALLAGAKLVTRAMVTMIGTTAAGRATHVEYLAGGELRPARIDADVVVLAASAIESARIALLSTSAAHPHGLGNRSGRVGRTLCFHASTFASAVMRERLHPHRGRSATHVMMEPCVPVTDSWLARRAGLPYLRGGVVEIGGSPQLIDEALAYEQVPFLRRSRHKELMRGSSLRDRMLGCRVDLDPTLRDVYGLPVARITYSPHRHDLLASLYWARKLRQICVATGAERALVYPAALGFATDPTANNTRHVSGTLRMGTDAEVSVTDPFGRLHDAENVVVCDGSLFPTSGAMNPTLTILALALRNATALAHGEATAKQGPAPPPPAERT